MKHPASAIAAFLLYLLQLSAAAAGGAPVVVELFTSQGCSSCPAADRILADLTERDDVIALALHVDYWDYIGWKDEFASPANTKRQRAYARAGDRRMVYTPQMIFNGGAHVEGANGMKISRAIDASRSGNAPEVQISRRGDSLRVRVAPARLDQPVTVQLVRFDPRRTVEILRGENRGKKLTYTNVVTEWRPLTKWDGRRPLDISTDVKGREGIAVLLQYPGPGGIVSAAQLR